ncbi:MAG: ATP-grasp domain-containing protein [Candidatus Latescibacteria bacterium]|nr:ATP-grasp domain-containing protein [Candidatus Latescibacterota bacterium]
MVAEGPHLLLMHTAGDPRPYTDRLRQRGYRLSLIKKRPSTADRTCFDQVVDWDYQEDLHHTLDLAAGLHRDHPLSGVLSFSESGVIAASLVARHLGLPGNPPRAALRARNKYLMRQTLQQAGLPTPPFHLVRSASQIHTLLQAAGQPMVLKPISGSSSYGVIRLTPEHSQAQIASRLDEVRSYIRDYRRHNPQYPFEFWLPPPGLGIPAEDVFSPEEDFLLEGFIPGQQFSVDGLACGDQITCLGVIEIERIKDTAYFMEYEEWMPTRLGLEREEQIQQVVAQAVRALGLERSCFHCEVKANPEGVFVLEVAARRGADNISDFLQQVMGIDIYEEGLRLACGEPRFYPDLQPRCCMKMRYFLPPASGTLQAIEGIEAVSRDPRLSELEFEVSPGDQVLTPPDGYEFLGYLSVVGATPAAAEAALEELYGRIRFHIAPAPVPSLVLQAG